MRIAILSNDDEQVQLITDVLTHAGHTCLLAEAADMLIVDADTVPDALPKNLPTLYLADRHAEDDILAALKSGASDYLIKPIRRNELATRVQVLLRRAYPEQEAPNQIRFDQYVFEPKSGRLAIAGKQVILTRKEFDVALLFFQHLGQPLSRATISDAIWKQEPDTLSRTVDTHVSRVRNKLNLKPENGFRLVPVYSYGYQLERL
jgi:DNA-binding response OmpR family regulator